MPTAKTSARGPGARPLRTPGPGAAEGHRGDDVSDGAGEPPTREPRSRGAFNQPSLRFTMVAPAIVVLAAVTILPLLYAMWMSVHTWKLAFPTHPFAGLDNFQRLLTSDGRFLTALKNTAFMGGTALVLEFLLGLALALFFWQTIRKARWLATVVLVPLMIAPVVVGFTARMAFNDSFGFVNQVLGVILGRNVEIAWLSDPSLAPYAIIFADVWQWTPFIFLVILAGLMSVSDESLEAARVDGASWGHTMRWIVFPSIKPILLVALILRGLDLVKLFDTVFLATRGGPGDATETITVYLYNVGFQFYDMGYAAAAGFLLLVLVTALVIPAIRLLARKPV